MENTKHKLQTGDILYCARLNKSDLVDIQKTIVLDLVHTDGTPLPYRLFKLKGGSPFGTAPSLDVDTIGEDECIMQEGSLSGDKIFLALSKEALVEKVKEYQKDIIRGIIKAMDENTKIIEAFFSEDEQ